MEKVMQMERAEFEKLAQEKTQADEAIYGAPDSSSKFNQKQFGEFLKLHPHFHEVEVRAIITGDDEPEYKIAIKDLLASDVVLFIENEINKITEDIAMPHILLQEILFEVEYFVGRRHKMSRLKTNLSAFKDATIEVYVRS